MSYGPLDKLVNDLGLEDKFKFSLSEKAFTPNITTVSNKISIPGKMYNSGSRDLQYRAKHPYFVIYRKPVKTYIVFNWLDVTYNSTFQIADSVINREIKSVDYPIKVLHRANGAPAVVFLEGYCDLFIKYIVGCGTCFECLQQDDIPRIDETSYSSAYLLWNKSKNEYSEFMFPYKGKAIQDSLILLREEEHCVGVCCADNGLLGK